jgi:nitric oxide reductase NorQ protein
MDQSEARRFGAAPFYAEQAEEIALFGHAFRQRLPLLIKGPTGCGKTRFVEHMAARLGRPLITVSCHDDLSAADLVGRHLIGPNGTVWADGPLARAVRTGAICYLDEVVEARKDTTVVLHPLADDRRVLPIERTGEQLVAPPEFMLVISYNPGYQNLLKSLKPSTRQRFVALTFRYPTAAVEQAILQAEAGVDAARAQALVRSGRGPAQAHRTRPRRNRQHAPAGDGSAAGRIRRADAHRMPRRDRRRVDRRRRHRSRSGRGGAGGAGDRLLTGASSLLPAVMWPIPLILPTHAARRLYFQIAFFAVFLLAPALDLLRFDLGETQLWFLGQRWSLGIDAFRAGPYQCR